MKKETEKVYKLVKKYAGVLTDDRHFMDDVDKLFEQPKRRVALSKAIWDKKTIYVPDGFGTFIQYSTDYEEYEAGPGNYPVAIIEKDDGTVKAYDLAQIKFIKEQ